MSTLVRIRDLIVADPVASEKWAQIVDHIVLDSAGDVRRIKSEIKAGDVAEAVLTSLQLWSSKGALVDLLGVLRQHGLNKLADEVQKSECWKVLNPAGAGSSSSLSPSYDWIPHLLFHSCTARKHDVEAIHTMLTEALTDQRACAGASIPAICICGLGGVGKSTVACLYARKYKSVYNGNVMWIDASTAHTIRASFFKVAAAHSQSAKLSADISNEELAANVFAACFNGKKALCIFDGVQKASDLDEFKPAAESYVGVLLTTRKIDIVPSMLMRYRLILAVPSLDECIRLIQADLLHSSREKAAMLADHLGRFPLALQQALSYIRDNYIETGNSAIDRYLQELEAAPAKLLNDSGFQKTSEYSKTTLSAWDVTLESIRDECAAATATTLINTVAYLNPNRISVAFLRAVFGSDADAGLKSLITCSMIQLVDDKVCIHRLVQLVLRLRLRLPDNNNNNPTSEAEVVTTVFTRLSVLLENEYYNELTKESASHGLHLFPIYAKHLNEGAGLRNLWSTWSTICGQLIIAGHYSDSLSLAQDAATLFAPLGQPLPGFGAEHEASLRMKWSTAVAQFHLENYNAAFSILDSILHVSKAALGSEHGLTEDILSMLGQVHSRQGNHEVALEIYDKMNPISERRLGDTHVSVLGYKFNQASAWMSCQPRRLDEALELLRQVLRGYVFTVGAEDIRTWNVKEQTGHVHFRMMNYEKAVQIWSAVLERYNVVLGEEHPSTAKLRRNISYVNEKLRRKSN